MLEGVRVELGVVIDLRLVLGLWQVLVVSSHLLLVSEVCLNLLTWMVVGQ